MLTSLNHVLTKYYGKINKYNKPTTQNSSVTNKAPFQKKNPTKSQERLFFKSDLNANDISFFHYPSIVKEIIILQDCLARVHRNHKHFLSGHLFCSSRQVNRSPQDRFCLVANCCSNQLLRQTKANIL